MKFNKKSLFLFALLGIFLISFVSAFSFGDFFNNVFGKMTGNVIADSSKVLNIDFDVLENISPKNGPAVVGNSGDYWNPIHPSKGYSLYRNSPAQDNNRSGFKYADGGRSSVVIRMINLAGGYTGNYGVNKDPMLSTINYQYDLERGNNGLPSYIYIYNLSVGNYDLYLYGPLGIYEVLIPDGYGRPQSYGIKNNTQNSQLLASTNKWTEGINYQVYSNLKISHFSDYLAINLIPSPGSPYHDTEISGLQLVPAGTRLAIGNVTPTIICNSAADCPQVTGTSSPYCSGSSLCTNDVSATCVSPGTVNSYCTTSNGASCVVCAQGCANNACINVQTNQTNTTATCIDSDGGLNYNVKGNVTFGSCTYGYNSGGCGGSSISDSCLGNTSANPGYLRETYCTANNSATFIDYQCPNGCALGACLPVQNQTNTTATCIDSDGGLNYNVKGNTYGISVFPDEGLTTKPDYCIQKNVDGSFNLNSSLRDPYVAGKTETCTFNCAIMEYFCSPESVIVANTPNCPNGCSNGACVTPSTQVCSQLIDRVKNPLSFNDSYGIQYQLTHNDTYVNYDSVSYTAGWNANDDTNYYYIYRNIQVYNDASFNASNMVKDLTRYNTCVERHYGTSTQYVCNYDVLSDNRYRYTNVFWTNKNVLVSETVMTGKSSLTEAEVNTLSLKSAQSLLDSIKNNQFKYTDSFDIDYRLSSLLSNDLSVCSSDLPTGELPYGMNCKLEPAVCPEYGFQKQVCQFYNEKTRQTESKETQMSCSPGICSGCYVPRWFGSTSGDNVCIPYGTKFGQSSTSGTDAIGEGYESQGSFDNYLNLTIYDSNRANLKVVNNGQVAFDTNIYVGNVYSLSDGGKIQFKVQKIVPEVGEKAFKVGDSFEDSGAYIHLDAVSDNNSVIVNGKLINLNASARVGDGIMVRVVDIGYHSNSPESSVVILDIGGYMIISEVKAFNAYCNYDGQIYQQKTTDGNGNWAKCQNSYECESGICSSGECVNVAGLMNQGSSLKKFAVRILCKFSNLFDGTAYDQCLIDYGAVSGSTIPPNTNPPVSGGGGGSSSGGSGSSSK